jgi:hypothetical protein
MSTQAQARASRRALQLAHACVIGATLATFARAVPYPLQLHWDDGRFIADNPLVQEVSLASLRAIVTRPHFEAFHPLHLLSYWLDVPLAGADGPALHATSLGLYALAASAVLALLMRLGLGPVPAVLGTLACVLHPVQVEAVSWATGRKDVLARLFAALAWGQHLRAERAWDRHAIGSALLYACGVLSKSTVLPLPLVIALGDHLLERRRLASALGFQTPKLLLAAGTSALVLSIWSQASMIREPAVALPARVLTTFTHHVHTLLWPSELAPMYPTELPRAPSAGAWLLLVS